MYLGRSYDGASERFHPRGWLWRFGLPLPGPFVSLHRAAGRGSPGPNSTHFYLKSGRMDEALGLLIDKLLASIADSDDARAEKAALALAERGDEATGPLCALLRDPDPDRRWWAGRALAAVATPDARAGLITALTDADSDVRACAAYGLGETKAVEAIPQLVNRLADPSAFVSRIAADSLARIGMPAVPALIAALESSETLIRIGAARALSIIQAHQAIPALCTALNDKSAFVSYYAEEALERMGTGIVLVRW